MNTKETNKELIESYIRLLSTLDLESRLEIISKLSDSVKDDLDQRESNFFRAFGAWQSEETADEMICSLRNSRSIRRNLETF